jgi:hypothetical protein
MDSPDNIDKLISSLNDIKKLKHKNEHKIKHKITKFSESYTQFKNSTEIMFCKLNELKNQIKKVEDDRTKFMDRFENQSNLIKKDKSKLETNSNNSNQTNNFKRFEIRESFLSKLFMKEDYETIYNIFLSFLIFLIAVFITGGILSQNHMMKFDQLEKLFFGFSFVLRSLILNIFISAISVLGLIFMMKNKLSRNFITFSYLINISLYVYYFTNENYTTENMSVICRIIYFSEIIRTLLKMFAYFLEKVWRASLEIRKGEINLEGESEDAMVIIKDKGVNNFNNKKEKFENGEEPIVSSMYAANKNQVNFSPPNEFSMSINFQKITYKLIYEQILNFLYFYFCPTLIYRDDYPKLKSISPKSILMNLINTLMGFSFNYIIVDMMLIPFINGNLNYLKPENILQTLLNFIVFSILILFVSFFGICHAYFNLFADIIGFGDREFYGDFWNARTPKEFISKIIFIFKEFFDYYVAYIIKRYTNLGSTLTELVNVFMIVSFIEYIAYYSLGYFFPVISFLIIFSRIISFVFDWTKISNYEVSNFFTWMLVSLGCGILVFISLTAYYIKNDINLDHGEICGYQFYTYFKGLC